MAYVESKQPCPRCVRNGRDKAGDNFHFYGDGRGGHCFSCGYTMLSDAEKEARGIDKFEWDDEQEKIVSTKEIITPGESEQIKSYTGTKGHESRGITDETYKAYAVRFEYSEETGEPTKHYYPYTENYKAAGYKIRILPKSFTTVGKIGKQSELFGQWKFKNSNSKNVVVCSGEVDCLSAFQMLENYRKSRNGDFEPTPVVSSGIGETGSYKQIQLQYEWLNRFDKIIICYDMDMAGKDAIKTLVKVLPKGKMFVMELPAKDTNEMLAKGKEKAWIDAYYKAKPYSPDGIVGSSGLSGKIREYAGIKKIPLPPFMHKVQDLMAGGIPLGVILCLGSSSGAGKCQGKGDSVLMADMTLKNVEDVLVGDFVMGDDGSPRKVLKTHSGMDNLYKVTDAKGNTNYTVTGNHRLSLRVSQRSPSRGWEKGDIVNISVEEYLTLSKSMRASDVFGYKADLTQLGKDSGFKEILKDEAYMLGLWLADGTSSAAQFTINVNDIELIEQFNNFAKANGYKTSLSPSSNRKGSISPRLSGGYRVYLREQGVLDNKHIPKRFLTADYETRLQVLAGFTDGDGYSIQNTIEMTLKDTQLAKDVLFLARSVGLSVHCADKFSKCDGFAGDIYKRMHISGNTDKIPNRLTRKKCQPRKQIKNALNSGLKVEPIGVGEYFGFEVDGNHLYCTGDFSVTHNSTFTDEMLYYWIFNSPYKIGIVSMESDSGAYATKLLSRHVGRKIDLISNDEEKMAFLNSQDIVEKEQQLFTDEHGNDRFYLIEDRDSGWEALKESIMNMIVTCDVKVICLDPVQDCFAGMNLEQQEKATAWLKGSVKSHGVTYILINHVRKNSGSGKANSQGADLTEEDFHGSSTLFKSSACNLLFMRNKEDEDEIARNTTTLKQTKCRWSGQTSPHAGKFYYDNATHRLWDFDDWMAQNPQQF